MNESYSQLKQRIIEKSMILVEAGDMSSVRKAMQALNEMAKLEPSSISSPVLEVDRLMATLGFAPDDQQFLKSEWISVSDAAKWSQVSQDTIREWCESGEVVAEVDANKKRKIWKVCPKSIGIKLHNIKDPRLQFVRRLQTCRFFLNGWSCQCELRSSENDSTLSGVTVKDLGKEMNGSSDQVNLKRIT